MERERYLAVQRGDEELTEQEIADGWHFCWEWDEMLIHPSWPEAEACTCEEDD